MNNLFKLGIFLLIFLNLLPASFVRDAVDIGHFFSSVHMFEYAFNHSFQFGVDIVDNVGPYGYLHYPYIYAGGAFWSKSLWFALICFVYAYYAASLIGRIRSAKIPVDLFVTEVRDDIEVEGLSDLESNNKESWRWAVGPATRIRFYVDPASPEQARQRLLKFAFKNGVPIKDQAVTIRLNGKDVRSFSVQEIDTSNQVDAEVMLTAKAGSNILTFVYGDWNHGKQNYGSNDPRKLAVVVMCLSL